MNASSIPSPDASREDLGTAFLDQIPFELYPVQEEALLSWFTTRQGVLVCAPTGTGKTLIAEAAVYEALHTGRRAYYTTPLIALTEQKLRELQAKAQSWGFSPQSIGLVTGNRRENPDAPVLVVVAEILFNRLLQPDVFDMTEVDAVVMDEFHSFADRDRGIVWELTLGLLPRYVRTLLLSATVGNSQEFVMWLRRNFERQVDLVESDWRRVPLSYEWVGDQLLSEQLVEMAAGEESRRRTPALVFCFNREECWSRAEQLKGKRLIDADRQSQLDTLLKQFDLTEGVGPKLRRILMRGIGVHHAGVLPKYRRIVEDLFQQKLLSICFCTETLAAGINLPARSVVLPGLLKGPPGEKKLIAPSAAHQMFGRAGRPQYDDEGFVYALAHEDDVKIARWRERYDQIPEETKDPGLRKAKKALKKKKPKRRTNQQYWDAAQFEKLRTSDPGKLYSKGPLPWRLLAHMLIASTDVDKIRELVGRRLMDSGRLAAGQRYMNQMLLALHRGGFVQLDPEPPPAASSDPADKPGTPPTTTEPKSQGLFGVTLGDPVATRPAAASRVPATRLDGGKNNANTGGDGVAAPSGDAGYVPHRAIPTERLQQLLVFRSVNPLYGAFLIDNLGPAEPAERLQALESVLEMPGSVARSLRVPPPEDLPPGPLATERLDSQLLQWGLIAPEQLQPIDPETGEVHRDDEGKRIWPLTLAEKLLIKFQFEYPAVEPIGMTPVWVAGELLSFGGSFNKLIVSRGLQSQEGIVFRHLLRFLLLLAEFQQLCPPDTTSDEWTEGLSTISRQVSESCRAVDASSTERTLRQTES